MLEIAYIENYVLGGLLIIMAAACLIDELLFQLALRQGKMETIPKNPSKPKFALYAPRNKLLRKLYFFGLYAIIIWVLLRAFEVIVDPV